MQVKDMNRALRELFSAVVMPVAGQTYNFFCLVKNEDHFKEIEERIEAVFVGSGVLKSADEFTLAKLDGTECGEGFTAEMYLHIDESRDPQDLYDSCHKAYDLSCDQPEIRRFLQLAPA